MTTVERRKFRWHKPFLKMLAETANLSACAKAVGVNVSTMKMHRQRYPEFAAACNAAIDQGCDRIEAALFAAAAGVNEPVLHNGEAIFVWRKNGEIVPPRTRGATREPLIKRVVNVRAAEIILRAHRPERYGERINIAAAVKHDGEIKHSGAINVHDAMKIIRSDPEMQQSAMLLAKRLNANFSAGSADDAAGDANGPHDPNSN